MKLRRQGQRYDHRGMRSGARESRMEMPTSSTGSTSRLLGLQQAARYLGVSPWTVRGLEASGVIPRVLIPLPNGRELRKLLFDKADLDSLIESWKLRS